MNRSIRTEIVINASALAIWSVLADFKQYPTWNPFISEISGNLCPGTKIEVTFYREAEYMRRRAWIRGVIEGRYLEWLCRYRIASLYDTRYYFEIVELCSGHVQLNSGAHFSGLLVQHLIQRDAAATRAGLIRMNKAIRDRARQLISNTNTA